MAASNTLCRGEQIPQGKARFIAQYLGNFGRRGRGRGLGPPSLVVNCSRGPIVWEGALSGAGEDRPGGMQARCRGWIPTSTLCPPRVPPTPCEDHSMMMGAHPRRRYPENSVSIPNPQPRPQQNQVVHPAPRYIPGEMAKLLHYDELSSPGQTLFCFWCGHPKPIPKYYPPPHYSPITPPHSESRDSHEIGPYSTP